MQSLQDDVQNLEKIVQQYADNIKLIYQSSQNATQIRQKFLALLGQIGYTDLNAILLPDSGNNYDEVINAFLNQQFEIMQSNNNNVMPAMGTIKQRNIIYSDADIVNAVKKAPSLVKFSKAIQKKYDTVNNRRSQVFTAGDVAQFIKDNDGDAAKLTTKIGTGIKDAMTALLQQAPKKSGGGYSYKILRIPDEIKKAGGALLSYYRRARKILRSLRNYKSLLTSNANSLSDDYINKRAIASQAAIKGNPSQLLSKAMKYVKKYNTLAPLEIKRGVDAAIDEGIKKQKNVIGKSIESSISNINNITSEDYATYLTAIKALSGSGPLSRKQQLAVDWYNKNIASIRRQ